MVRDILGIVESVGAGSNMWGAESISGTHLGFGIHMT